MMSPLEVIMAIAPMNHVWPIAPGFISVLFLSERQNLGVTFGKHSAGRFHSI